MKEMVQLNDLLTGVSAAVVPALPGGGWSVVGEQVPDDAPAAIVTRSGPIGVALVPSAAFALALQAGPPPLDLVDALTPALQLALAELNALGGAEPASQVPAAEAIEAPPGHGRSTMLLVGEAGSIAVVVTAPEATPVEPVGPTAGFPQEDLAPVEPLHPAAAALVGHHPLEVLSDVELGVTAELGRTRMLVRDVLSMAPGSVIELDRTAGSPVDLLVNGTLVARGEVIVVDEEFGVRVTEIIGYDAPNPRGS